ncbi:MAG TPA: anion permease [Bacilli bacterium]
MILVLATFAAAFFFAVNIGASGTAAAMSAAYGAGAVQSRRAAVWLVAVCAFLGANFGGAEVVRTLGKGIIPHELSGSEITLIILISACMTLFYANRLGLPLSTSEVTVGSIVGVGVAFQQIHWPTLFAIIAAWLMLPVCALLIAFAIRKLCAKIGRKETVRLGMSAKWLSCLLIAAGCYEAFSAGMNNVGNAVGPLIGAGLIDIRTGVFFGAVFLALGAITLGGKVLETGGKKIASLTLAQGSIASFTSGSLVIAASLFGIPVPLTQATTMAIIGAGSDALCLRVFKQPVVRKILKIWSLSPFISMLVSLILVEAFIMHSALFLWIFASVFVTTACLLYVKLKTV